MPASLVVLLREQLCGSNPDLHQQYLAQQRFREAAFNAGLGFQQTGEQLSVRKLADAADVGRGTAERWLADKHFHLLFGRGRRFAASKDFLKWKKTVENAARKKRAGARAGVPSKNTRVTPETRE